MEIKGKVVSVLKKEIGQSAKGEWQKQQIVIETDEKFPKKICLMFWGDKVDLLKDVKEGGEVNAFINIESREYNSRWYTDVKVWKMDVESGGSDEPVKDEPSTGVVPDDDLPF